MGQRAAVGSVTFAEFLEIVHEDQKADLLDGVIYMASPENLEHNELILWLATILQLFVRRNRLGTVTVNRVAYRLAHTVAPEPDIAVVLTDRQHLIKRGYVDGPPDLAIELVSPDSISRDYETKRAAYEAAGVREYWIIDPDEQTALFLVRGESGFVEAQPEGHVFASLVLPGFNLDVRWLWQRPLPDELEIVQALLARANT